MRDEVQVDQVSGLLTRYLQQRAMLSQKQNWIKRGAFIRTKTAASLHEGVARHQVSRIKQRTAHDIGDVLIDARSGNTVRDNGLCARPA